MTKIFLGSDNYHKKNIISLFITFKQIKLLSSNIQSTEKNQKMFNSLFLENPKYFASPKLFFYKIKIIVILTIKWLISTKFNSIKNQLKKNKLITRIFILFSGFSIKRKEVLDGFPKKLITINQSDLQINILNSLIIKLNLKFYNSTFPIKE